MLNNIIQLFKFKVINGTPLGMACVATENIQKGAIICKMSGTPISYKQFCEKFNPNCDNLLQIGQEQYVILMEPFFFFNHSCNPNAGLRNKGILFALRNIKKGEKITYDYSTTADDLLWEMDCKCGENNCRKKIRDFHSLPHERKEFFFREKALLDHILETFY